MLGRERDAVEWLQIARIVEVFGVGEQKDGYSTNMENAIRKLFPKQVGEYRESLPKNVRESLTSAEPTAPVFREALWAGVTSGPQNEFWKQVNKSHDLDMIKLRKFFVAFGGDAVGYPKDSFSNAVYNAINKVVQEQIDSVKEEYPNDTFEFTFVTHSLGTIVGSNYLYDNHPDRKAQPNGKIKATNLFTRGSPIAIWTLRFGGPVKATHPVQISRPNGAWINILDDEDIIGFPLRDLNPKYREGVDMGCHRDRRARLHGKSNQPRRLLDGQQRAEAYFPKIRDRLSANQDQGSLQESGLLQVHQELVEHLTPPSLMSLLALLIVPSVERTQNSCWRSDKARPAR